MATNLFALRLSDSVKAALAQVAKRNLRSLAAQANWYLIAGLRADGVMPPEDDPAVPVVVPQPAATPSAPRPKTQGADAVVTGVNVELRRAGKPSLVGLPYKTMVHLIDTRFPEVTDLASARAIGVELWIAANAGVGLVGRLFPDDPNAVVRARRHKGAKQAVRTRGRAPDVQQFAHDRKLNGGAAASFYHALAAPRFAGMSIAQAVQLGRAAWMDAGLSVAAADKLFGNGGT